MRGREFLMKDLYSFSRTEEEHNNFYNSMKDSYTRVFEKVGLGDYTYLTAASGGSFGDNSDEFQTVSEAGEDIIYIDKDKKKAINKEIYADEVINSEGLNKSTLEEKKSIEVGNIFPLGTKFSDALELTFTDESGSQNPVIMGSYGIGIGRLMGTVVEVLSDEKGIVWPETISPFDAHIILMSPEDDEVRQYSDKIYNELNKSMHDILYDDRTKKAGEKLNDADLIGIPYQIIIGKKTLEEGKIEVKNRKNGEITHLDESAVLGGKFKV
jgi:prolyl-tRNA synthetase